MEKLFVPYELALKLKELGFDERCLAGYYNDGKSLWFFRFHKNSEREPTVAERFATAPLWQQAFDWLDKHFGLFVSFDKIDNTRKFYYDFSIIDSIRREYNDEDLIDSASRKLNWSEFKTYQEARLACLEKLIELCKKHLN